MILIYMSYNIYVIYYIYVIIYTYNYSILQYTFWKDKGQRKQQKDNFGKTRIMTQRLSNLVRKKREGKN